VNFRKYVPESIHANYKEGGRERARARVFIKHGKWRNESNINEGQREIKEVGGGGRAHV
jgi:hypothetical protein